MSSWKRARFAVAVIAAPVLLGGALCVPAPAAAASACRSWSGGQPPDHGGSAQSNTLNGVAVLSTCSAWAVGDYVIGTTSQTLTEHWNGSAWRLIASPDVGGSALANELVSVAATSDGNAWAVGSYFTATNSGQTLILHWNGHAWKKLPSPDPGGAAHSNLLSGVAAASARSAWAVGSYSNGTANQTLIEHWNGRAWKLLKSPNPGGPGHDNDLISVTASSLRLALAVGASSTGTANRTLIEQWNGRAWKAVPSADPGATFNVLAGVSASSPADAWAVGGFGSPIRQNLAFRWS